MKTILEKRSLIVLDEFQIKSSLRSLISILSAQTAPSQAFGSFSGQPKAPFSS
jgi:hypothetical protein